MYLNAHRRPAAVEDGGVDVAHRPGLLQKVKGDDYNRLSGCIKRVAAAANPSLDNASAAFITEDSVIIL
jgi:hypothetical protein